MDGQKSEEYRNHTKLFIIIALVGTLVFSVWATVRIVEYVDYQEEIGGHINRAKIANTVPTAIQEMRIVVRELEEHGYTSGCTCIFFNFPENDIGFWYNNLKESLQELEDLPPNASTLETSNTLLKLRETLEKAPNGITIYPHNTAFFSWGTLSALWGGGFWILLFGRYMKNL